MQISARTPTCAAMTALTLDHLSNGRLLLGVGVSGPQVVEGWYGQPFTRPLERTREWIEIFRKVIAREEPVEFHGQQYQLPCTNGMGLGKPLKSITHPLRKRIPVLLGAEGPKNVALAAEKCDGWLPIFCSPYKMKIFDESLAGAAGRDFEIAAMVNLAVNDDLKQALLPGKWTMALYLGGMGAKGMNFHKDLLGRMGYAEDAQRIQDLFLSGKQMEAVEAVPDALVDEISLAGPAGRVRERLQDWKKTNVTSLLIGHSSDFDLTVRNMEFLAKELL
jgi:F420-dependent oxidoreductase-like protein